MESKKGGGGGGDGGSESEVEKEKFHEAVRALQDPEKRLRNQKRNQSKDSSGERSSLELAGLSGPLAFSSRMIEEKRSKGKQEENLPNEKSLSLKTDSEKVGVSDSDATVSLVKTEVEGSSVIPRRKKGKALVPAPKKKGPQKNKGNENRMTKVLVKGANSPSSSTTHLEGETQVIQKKKSDLESDGKGEGTFHGTDTEGDSEWEDIEEGKSATKEGEHSEPPPVLQKSGRGRKIHRARFVAGRRFSLPRRPNTFMREHRYPPQSGAINYLQAFFSFLYYAGMSPMKPKSARQLPKWFLILQTVLYCVFTIFSTVPVLDEVKYGWINFRAKGGLLSFVIFGFCVSNCMTRLYNVYLLYKSSSSTAKISEKIDKLNTSGGKPQNMNGTNPEQTPNEERNTVKLIVYAIGTIAVMLAGANTIFGDIPIYQWAFTNAMQDRSVELSESLYIWTSSNYSNVREQLTKDYGKEVTLTTGVFAVIGNIFCFFGTLHGCLILDLLPMITLQIYCLQKPLSSSWKRNSSVKRKCRLPIYWQYYMDVRNICDDIDDTFGNQLKLVHVQNVLFFGYFLHRLLNKDPISVDFLIDLFCIVKVSITYYFARQVGDKNEIYEDYVAERLNGSGCTVTINGKKESVSILMRDMTKHPIGIGRGEFFINESFIIKVFMYKITDLHYKNEAKVFCKIWVEGFEGLVISIFLFLSAESKV